MGVWWVGWVQRAVVVSEARSGLVHSYPQAKSNEEGLRLVEDLGHYFRDVHLWWMGPLYPILRLVHPKFVAPLLQAPGISSRSLRPQPLSSLCFQPFLPLDRPG